MWENGGDVNRQGRGLINDPGQENGVKKEWEEAFPD
jgi:hypothetical protein